MMPTMMIGTEIMGTSLFFIHSTRWASRAGRSGLSLQLVDANLQGIQDLNHPHLAALGDGFCGLGVPELAMDEDLAFGAEVGLGDADLSDQPFLAGEGFLGMSPDPEKQAG